MWSIIRSLLKRRDLPDYRPAPRSGKLRRAMLSEAFVRMGAGEWFCRAPLGIIGPTGSVMVTPGVVYRTGKPLNGLDIALLLDSWHATGSLPANITVQK
jgi:hypothetical protein